MPFQKGKSGNPGGKPKEKEFYQALQMQIKEAEDPKLLRNIAQTLLDKAKDGEKWAIEMLADRLDGKPAQEVNSTATVEVTEYAVDVSKLSDETLRELIAAGYNPAGDEDADNPTTH